MAPTRSSPVRVRDVLVAALPELESHMLLDGIRKDWASIVGPEISRRCQPGGLRQGVLDVIVDNSPWLHELTLRSSSLLANLTARRGSAVTGLRFVLGPVTADGRSATPRRRRHGGAAALEPAEVSAVESMLTPVADPALAASLRRLVTKDLLARRSLDPGRRSADPPPSARGSS